MGRARRRRARAASLVATGGAGPPPAPQEALERHRAVAAFASAVDRLPQNLAELHHLLATRVEAQEDPAIERGHLRVTGLSYGEMARVVKAPLGTARSRLHAHGSRPSPVRALTAFRNGP